MFQALIISSTFGDIHYNIKICQYYMEAGIELLNSPCAWYYDQNSEVLHNTSVDFPSSHLQGRVVDYGIEITNTSGLIISGMKLCHP